MRPAPFFNNIAELCCRLTDARVVCHQLGLDAGSKPQAKGLLIRCPWHQDNTPSCSVRQVPDGKLIAHCFGCGMTGDVFTLVAVARGLDIRRDFPQVLNAAAELVGFTPANRGTPKLVQRPESIRPPKTNYPPAGEVASLWASCRPIADDGEVAGWFRLRHLDPGIVQDRDLARALPQVGSLPAWARLDCQSWAEMKYRCILPMFDDTGALRSLRARRVVVAEGPKAVAPARFQAGALVLADSLGRLLLETGKEPELWPDRIPLRLVIAEGEPDYLTWATRFSDADETAPAVVGIGSGSWTTGFAARVPAGARVVVRTHHDDAGEKYAVGILKTLAGRCTVLRGDAGTCPLCPRYGWRRGAA